MSAKDYKNHLSVSQFFEAVKQKLQDLFKADQEKPEYKQDLDHACLPSLLAQIDLLKAIVIGNIPPDMLGSIYLSEGHVVTTAHHILDSAGILFFRNEHGVCDENNMLTNLHIALPTVLRTRVG